MGGSGVIADDWEFPSESGEVRTIVLIGRTGNGKSATGNSIIGSSKFISKCGLEGVTVTCQLEKTNLENGLTLNVIDTPGLFDFSGETEYIGKEIVKCIDMAKDGIHAFLVVLSIRNRFSREEEASIRYLRNFFGSKICEYMIVVITGGDDLEENDETLDKFLGNNCPEPFKEILRMCGNRCILFDNKTKDDVKKQEQLQKLLILVNEVVTKNNGKPYTDEFFIELKMLAMQLREQKAQVYSSDVHSKEEKYMFYEHMMRSYEELIKRLTETVELKLKETICRLECELMAQKASLLKVEANAQETQMKSENEINKLRESLEKAKKETEDLRNKTCSIL